jgi:hypothetical protein
MAAKQTIDRLARSIEKLAGQVELRHGTFEPCEAWILDGDRAWQIGKPDVVITAAELEARPMPRTRTGIGRVVHVIVDPPPRDQQGRG